MIRGILQLVLAKTPTLARIFCALFLILPGVVHAQSWDEEAFVRQALEVTGEKRLSAELSRVQAEVGARTAHPLPRLELEYEPMWANDLRRDEFVIGVSQSVDLSGWRKSLRTAAALKKEASTYRAKVREQEIASMVRLSFWHVRFYQERLARIQAVELRFQEALRVIQARADAGDAAGLDVVRVQRQLTLVRAEIAKTGLQLEEAWGALLMWKGAGERPEIVGVIKPEAPKMGVGAHVELRSLELERAAKLEEIGAFGSPGLRDWEVGLGYRLERESEIGHGALVSLTIPLALWNIDTPVSDSVKAEAALIDVEAQELERKLAAARTAAVTRLEQSLGALAAMPNPDEDSKLSQGVQQAYGADEASLFDLIEAVRSELELGLARIDLEWEARRAFIDLQYLSSSEQTR